MLMFLKMMLLGVEKLYFRQEMVYGPQHQHFQDFDKKKVGNYFQNLLSTHIQTFEEFRLKPYYTLSSNWFT